MQYSHTTNAGPLSKVLRRVEKKYAHDKNVRAVFVAGSVARGDATALSDIDLIHIVRKPRTYVRYYLGPTHVEVKSVTLREIFRQLRKQPMSYFQFWDTRPLYDPEHLYDPVMKRLRAWQRSYRVDQKMKGDLYITLDHVQRKILSAQRKGDTTRALWFATVGLEHVIASLFALNDRLVPPAGWMIKLLPTLRKKPTRLNQIVKAMIRGQQSERLRATVQLLEYVVPRLRPAMRHFRKYYRPLR